MKILVVHLTDIHMGVSSNPILERAGSVVNAIVAELDISVEEIHLVIGGDFTQSGGEEEFENVANLLDEIVSGLHSHNGSIEVKIVAVPGNHDCCFDEDQSIRDVAIESTCKEDFSDSKLQPSIRDGILAPLKNYFEFVEMVGFSGAISNTKPFYDCVNIQCGDDVVQYHLINSAWMSAIREQTGSLVFPLTAVAPVGESTPSVSICVIHHPYNWFRQPVTMRPLRDRIEEISDIVLFGHEHTPHMYGKKNQGGMETIYFEGAVLQDRSDSEQSGFHVLKIDTILKNVEYTTLQWKQSVGSGFFAKLGSTETVPWVPAAERTSVHRVRKEFDESLNDPGLPVSHKKRGALKLDDFYVPPDLRVISDNTDKPGIQVRSEDIVSFFDEHSRLLIIAADKSGKTSFTKKLFRDMHDSSLSPLLISGSDLPKSGNPTTLRNRLCSIVSQQYENLSSEEFEQLPQSNRVLIIDDLELGPTGLDAWESCIQELDIRFGKCIYIVSEQFYIKNVNQDTSNRLQALAHFKHLYMLPFGFIRCEQFVHKWVSLDSLNDRAEVDTRVQEILKSVDDILRSNAIPHHPWIVTVLVQNVDSPDLAAAETGSYGHLLQALITAALQRTNTGRLPLEGQYTYLSSLAEMMFNSDTTVLSDASAREFHEQHKKKYGLGTLEYDSLLRGFVDAGILDNKDDGLSFHHKYTFSFFVAWDLAQRLNKQDKAAESEVRRLVSNLYHDDTANIIVFLAHLTTSPTVLTAILDQAMNTYQDIKATNLSTDIDSINGLNTAVSSFVLPDSDPSENNRRWSADIDESDSTCTIGSHDGRSMATKPKSSDDEAYEGVRQINSALRTIEILGQVLRNSATSKLLDEKITIAREIFRLGRRLMGFIFQISDDNLPRIVSRLEENYREKYKAKNKGKHPKDAIEISDQRIADEVSQHIYTMHNFTAFAVMKHVANSVGGDGLDETFKTIFAADNCVPNRMYDMAICLDRPLKTLPVKKAVDLDNDLDKNRFGKDLLRTLVVEHLYLYRVQFSEKQSMCQKLDIGVSKSVLDPKEKKRLK